jgi:hypothetical protein
MPEASSLGPRGAAELRAAAAVLRRRAYEEMERRRWRATSLLVEQRIMREHQSALRQLARIPRPVEA